MNRIGILIAALTTLAAFTPAPAAATVSTPVPYVVVEDIAAMQVPSSLVTWSLVPILGEVDSWKLTIHDVDGSVFGALRFTATTAPPITVEMGAAPLLVPGASPPGIGILSNCTSTIHSYQLCADVSYAGGSGALWNMGSTSGQSNGYYCYNCLTIQGCYEALFTFCDRQVLFTVAGSSTGASVCWTWGAWRDVWTKAIYDGASVTSNRVWVTATTTC